MKKESAFVPLEELPKDYSLTDAKNDGCVIMEDGDVTSGESDWNSFVEKTNQGEAAHIRYCHHYTLGDSPEHYGTTEDYPKMYIHDLHFDGDKYTVRWFEDGTEITREYKYMLRFEEKPQSEWATYTKCTRYVLVNDKDITWDDIFKSMISSLSFAYIDHLTVYTDYIYENE